MTQSDLSVGTYDVLRGRLRTAAADLRERLSKLDADRAEVFGNIQTELLATARITTDHNCTPRDVVAIGETLLLGYNVQFGLKSEITLADVFAGYRIDGTDLHQSDLAVIDDPTFANDFAELYRFYKDTRFARFYIDGPHLHLVFRVGKRPTDIKTFKWLMADGGLTYVDNRSDHEVRDPPQHEFRWTRTTRDQHHYGTHPHINIDDRVFVETVGGDLTIKVENNTESGEGIYAEPVDDPDQQLDDAEIHYAIVGHLVLLKIRPYKEDATRYVLFNGKNGRAMRLDEIGDCCVLLPGDHGIIFPGGYYLQTGEFKRLDHGQTAMRYQRTVASPNGEDFLYLFYNAATGMYVQLRYNLIRQSVDTPLVAGGQTIFDDGRMVCFQAEDSPHKHHSLQIWQTPMTAAGYVREDQPDSMLFKIGNRDLVRGMAECGETLSLIDKAESDGAESYEDLYVDLVKKSSDVLDTYFWIDDPAAHQLAEPLTKIRDAASAAVDEFEKVVRSRRQTADRTGEVAAAIEALVTAIERGRFDSVQDYVDAIADLREQRGHAIGLRQLKHADEDRIDAMERTTAEWTDRISHRCVEYLLTPGSLDEYSGRVAAAETKIDAVESVADAKELSGEIDAAGDSLQLLTETVSNLRIDDAVKRTEIIDSLSGVLASLNRVRSRLKSRINDLVGVEGRAEFASQMKLLSQTVAGYLEVCDTAEDCDGYLTRVMVQIEELEGRFAEFDEFVIDLASRREEIYEAFESRKVQLVERRNRRAESLSAAASRVLSGIDSRVSAMDDADAIAGYFAGDLMVDKVRDIISQLQDLGDSVRAGDLQSRLKTIREDAVRSQKDRADLYEDGGDIIRLGQHRFAVNRQPLDLTTVVREGQLCLHLTGTQYFEPLAAPELEDARDLWDQPYVSENADVYRGEFLAYRRMMGLPELPAGQGGYAKGVHDVDAEKIGRAVQAIGESLGRLRHSPSVRAAAVHWWRRVLDAEVREGLERWIGGFAALARAFPEAEPAVEFRAELSRGSSVEIADYLFEELVGQDDRFVVSGRAAELWQRFEKTVPDRQAVGSLSTSAPRSLRGGAEAMGVGGDTLTRGTIAERWSTISDRSWTLAGNWADAFLATLGEEDSADPASNYRDELAEIILAGGIEDRVVASADVAMRVDGLVGDHRRIESSSMTVHYHDWMRRLSGYVADVVPRFETLQSTKQSVLRRRRGAMRLDEFKPEVLTSFVRNRLIDEVYLPMIGDNLAKQMGTAGENKRTDTMGLLMLISPPGYGKTTLMEYVANRLGIVFMKINGPAIGHGVTSLDPDEAPNAAAREEVERLNLALEMGDNVMLYLDDIQHTHPELLQKFISLCDATRKIEGVRDGKTRTYDLRGRRVAVVMAGNPYTESGDRFQVPDMLSNRADVYNLGEIIGEAAEAFEMSYLENCLTSNATLSALSTAPPEDARAIIGAAMRGDSDDGGVDLQSNLSADDVREMTSVMRKLLTVRDAVLKVNRAYIASAAQADAYRVEPPFKLQGSYRNMNRIAERVAAVMNDAELRSLIVSSYEQEAQTLTTDNEANVLKFKELMGLLSVDEKERWDAIKYAYVQNVRMAGMADDDAAGQLMRQLASVRDGLESIRGVISHAVASRDNSTEDRMDARIDSIRGAMLAAGQELAVTLAKTGQSIEQISKTQALDPPDQQVIVQHKVPRVLVDLVRGQFHLMQEWLRPILDESVDNGRDLEKLRDELQRLLKTYAAVEGSIEGSGEAPPGSVQG